MSTKTCNKCKFWQPSENVGECRRRAPLAGTQSCNTSPDYWCGEWVIRREDVADSKLPVPLDQMILGILKTAEDEGWAYSRTYLLDALIDKGYSKSTTYRRVKDMLAKGQLTETAHPTLGNQIAIAGDVAPSERRPMAVRIHTWDTYAAYVISFCESSEQRAGPIRRHIEEQTGRDIGHIATQRILDEGVRLGMLTVRDEIFYSPAKKVDESARQIEAASPNPDLTTE
jgi:hypothetical protein